MILSVGMSATLMKTFADQETATFAAITLDTNPVHIDQSYAEMTPFRSRIVHGMHVSSLISAVLGTQLPGNGALYLSQTLRFCEPVYLGETVTAKVTITDISPKGIVNFETICVKQDDMVVVEGQASVRVPRSMLPRFEALEQKVSV